MDTSKMCTSWSKFAFSSFKAEKVTRILDGRWRFCLFCLLLATSAPEISCRPTADDEVDRNDVTAVGSSPPECAELPKSELKKQWTAHHGGQSLHPSYYLLPQFRQFIEPELTKPSSPNEFPLYGDQECPDSLYDMSKLKDVQDRSLCPWYNVLTHDVTRYPADLVEAHCRCTSCVGINRATGAGCEPVYYNLPVLRRTDTCDEKGFYKYEKSWQRLAVGCTCAMAPTN